MKKIGFVDFYLSEWHANNYPAWLRDACEKLGADYEVAYAWAETEVSLVDGVTSREWCDKMGVTLCGTLEELCEKSDVILVLAPSDPDKHLGYAKVVLPYGKRTYIDKTFAPDLATAEEIFAIAKAHGTPFFSTSALRYATELDLYGTDCKCMMTTGSGKSAEEYIIHQVEMIVRKLGIGAKSARAERIGENGVFFHIFYDDGRDATMTYTRDKLPFTVHMSGGEEKGVYAKAESKYFVALMEDIVRFFETGEVSFDTKETLEVMKIREGALRAMETPGQTIEL